MARAGIIFASFTGETLYNSYLSKELSLNVGYVVKQNATCSQNHICRTECFFCPETTVQRLIPAILE